jgi:outer membrane lipoprotein SlyB
MDITSLIVAAVSGAVGGNVAGAAMKEKVLVQWGIPLPELSAAGSAARSCKW